MADKTSMCEGADYVEKKVNKIRTAKTKMFSDTSDTRKPITI